MYPIRMSVFLGPDIVASSDLGKLKVHKITNDEMGRGWARKRSNSQTSLDDTVEETRCREREGC